MYAYAVMAPNTDFSATEQSSGIDKEKYFTEDKTDL